MDTEARGNKHSPVKQLAQETPGADGAEDEPYPLREHWGQRTQAPRDCQRPESRHSGVPCWRELQQAQLQRARETQAENLLK